MSTPKYNWRCTRLWNYLIFNIKKDEQDMHENEIKKS